MCLASVTVTLAISNHDNLVVRLIMNVYTEVPGITLNVTLIPANFTEQTVTTYPHPRLAALYTLNPPDWRNPSRLVTSIGLDSSKYRARMICTSRFIPGAENALTLITYNVEDHVPLQRP